MLKNLGNHSNYEHINQSNLSTHIVNQKASTKTKEWGTKTGAYRFQKASTKTKEWGTKTGAYRCNLLKPSTNRPVNPETYWGRMTHVFLLCMKMNVGDHDQNNVCL